MSTTIIADIDISMFGGLRMPLAPAIQCGFRSRRELKMAGSPRRRLKMFDSSLDYGLLPSLTGFALRRASLHDFGGFGEAVRDRSITPLRYSLLEVVGANPGLSQVQLAETLGLAKPAATLAIDYWEGRKCVTRRKDPSDRRSYGIVLTKIGEDTLGELQTRIVEHDARLTKSLSVREFAQLRSLLQRIYQG